MTATGVVLAAFKPETVEAARKTIAGSYLEDLSEA